MQIRSHQAFYFLTFSVIALLLLPALATDSMFIDGLEYASISRNLAEGNGSLWNLYYTHTLDSEFHAHPPLFFWTQSLFFKLFGDHLFIEKLYCLIAAVLTAFLIHKIWSHIFRGNKEIENLSWLPILFWIITPVVFWSYTNNMIENTLMVFTLASVYFILRGFSQNRILNLTLGALFLFAGLLTKGPAALFPLAVIPIYAIIHKYDLKKAVGYFLILITTLLILIVILLLNEEVRQSLKSYYEFQILKTFRGMDGESKRYYILLRLVSELLPMMIFAFVTWIILRLKKINFIIELKLKNTSLFFLVIGLSASLPIIISPKQLGFYLVSSIPYFAMAFAVIMAPLFTPLLNRSSKNLTKGIVTISTFILLISSISFFIKLPEKDAPLINDVWIIGNYVPENSTIDVCPELWHSWPLHAYFQRYYKISLSDKFKNTYYLSDANCNVILEGYKKVEAPLTKFTLYKKQN